MGSKKIHGHANRYNQSPEYRAWKGVKQRCLNKKDKSYSDYGGRGIKVCDRWMDFNNFFSDMGPKPSALHSIERIDNDGDYEPKNCIWATNKEQARNKRPRGGKVLPNGVFFRESRSCYQVTLSSKYIGTFKTAEEAIAARDEAEQRLWGKSS